MARCRTSLLKLSFRSSWATVTLVFSASSCNRLRTRIHRMLLRCPDYALRLVSILLSNRCSCIVETSSARVISEDERRLAGWVLLSPEERGVTLSSKLEEKILLLVRQPSLIRVEIADNPDKHCGVCCILQLLARQGVRLHPYSASFDHRIAAWRVYHLGSARSRTRSQGECRIHHDVFHREREYEVQHLLYPERSETTHVESG